MSDVRDNPDLRRFELTEDGATAFASYAERGGVFAIAHVEAPPALRGKGTAGRLMEGIVALARQRSLRIVPTCPYAVAWFKRHPEARDVLG